MQKTVTFKRLTAVVLTFMMAFGCCFGTAFAETSDVPAGSTGDAVVEDNNAADTDTEEGTTVPDEEDGAVNEDDDQEAVKPSSTEITAIKDLKSNVKRQTIEAYSEVKPVLPKSLDVKMAGSDDFGKINVEWVCDKTFSNKKVGTYTYTPTIDSNYKLAENVELVTIIVKVVKAETKITGVLTSFSKTARGSDAYDNVTVYNGYGKTLKLQRWTGSKWITEKTYGLENVSKQTLKVTYSRDWWYSSVSKWRMTIAPGDATTGFTSSTITVKRIKAETKITGVDTSFSKKSRKTAYDIVTVYNGYGRNLKLQRWTGSKWITEKTIKLKDSNKQNVKVTYTNDWWKTTSSKWRLLISEGSSLYGFKTKTINLKTIRYYQNPSKYVQIQDDIEIDDSGAYSFGVGYMGLKVRAVNRYFGIGNKYWPRYTSTTKSKVMAFQRKKGLNVTGVVNKATWNAFGFTDYYWNNLGAYISPIKVNPYSSKEDHIEAMIDRAYDYLGSDYVVGASGAPEKGADCSGLVMQALYAAGVEIPGINPVTHSRPGHEFESRNMWNNADFKKIPYSKKKRGDLIFYKGSSGLVNHVAIYLGNGKVIESWPNKVRIANVGHHPIMGVMRVFN